MKHGISPTRDPSMFNNKGMKIGALILTHEVSKRTGKLMPFKIHKARLNKSERRVEKRRRREQRERDFLIECDRRGDLHDFSEGLRKARDRAMAWWHLQDHCLF